MDGQIYAVPVAMENVLMFRNTDLAPDAPASINEMAETGLALQAEGKTQYPIGMQVGDKGDAYHAYPFYSAAGGYFFAGPDADGNYDINDLGVGQRGLAGLREGLGRPRREGRDEVDVHRRRPRNGWAAGELPYWITGPWNKGIVKDSGVHFEVEAVPGLGRLGLPRPVPIVGSPGLLPEPGLGQHDARRRPSWMRP